jgi:hypothetical protein
MADHTTVKETSWKKGLRVRITSISCGLDGVFRDQDGNELTVERVCALFPIIPASGGSIEIVDRNQPGYRYVPLQMFNAMPDSDVAKPDPRTVAEDAVRTWVDQASVFEKATMAQVLSASGMSLDRALDIRRRAWNKPRE